jgi:hypothetical protein
MVRRSIITNDLFSRGKRIKHTRAGMPTPENDDLKKTVTLYKVLFVEVQVSWLQDHGRRINMESQ